MNELKYLHAQLAINKIMANVDMDIKKLDASNLTLAVNQDYLDNVDNNPRVIQKTAVSPVHQPVVNTNVDKIVPLQELYISP